MSDRNEPPVPAGSLEEERERAVQRLGAHFASDRVTLEELERRLELVYRAGTLTQLRALLADLEQGAPPVLASPAPVARPVAGSYPTSELIRGSAAAAGLQGSVPVPAREVERMLAVMGNRARKGTWVAPHKLEVVAVMAETTIDLTNAILPPGIMEIDASVVMAQLKIIVPPGMGVENRMSAIMAEVREHADIIEAGALTARMLRVTGLAFMSEVRITVRHRE